MMYFSRLKTTLILAVCALGVLLCVPNFLPAPAAGVPWRTVRLGLDLRGGSYLLLELDLAAVTKERLDTLADGARKVLRGKITGYQPPTVQPAQDRVLIRMAPGPQQDDAVKLLRDAAAANGSPDYQVDVAGTDITLTIPAATLRDRATAAVTQSIEIVRRRIDDTGVLDPQITRQGDNRIVVQLPGVDDPNRIKELIGKTARMTFRLVDDNANPLAPPPPGDDILPMEGQPNQKIAIRKHVEVDGANLTDARPGQSANHPGSWVVNFTFDSIGTRSFAAISRANVGHRFAVVLDDKVITAPVINEPITGGRGEISGNFTAQSASDLAVLLRAGALPAPLTVVEERSVGPELGEASIRAGAIALGVGFMLVIAYMAMFYGLFGWFANIALVFNLVLQISILNLLEATLTLPGMAGILLTLGVAVDANILINERIREEVRNGRTPLNALETGFRKAYGTIVDSNATAFLAHVMLFVFGSGPVRGFAVTITVGIVTTLFTATVFARLLTVRWYLRTKPKVLPVDQSARFGPLFRLVRDGTTTRFMRGRHLGLIVSAVLSTASLLLYFYPGLSLGIDFRGGVVMEVRTPEPADFAQIRAGLAAAQVPNAGVQRFGGPDQVLIRLDPPGGDTQTQTLVAQVRQGLEQAAPGTRIVRTDAVGASVSDELFRNGMLALGISLLMILAYIWFRFEWQFAVGAVVTLILDVTKAIGFLVVTRVEFDLVMVAAILTVIGYSTNDKVVVYDRMRENLRKYKTMPLRQLIDLSINETLNRTLGTSMTVFLASLPLALFGGASLSGFALMMLFGIVVGTSSSIFIAAPILLLLGENRLRRDAQPPSAPKGPPVAAAPVRTNFKV